MLYFHTLKELINALNREKELVNSLFEKRRIAVRAEDVLALLEYDPERLQKLLDSAILVQNNQFVELEERYLDFFEQVMEVNEEINTAYIHENIEAIKNNILFYLEENNLVRKESYLKKIKSDLRKIGKTTLRNVIDLSRNIENVYKTEPTFRIKLAKLKHYDVKREAINHLILTIDALLEEDERLFFRTAMDEELIRIVIVTRHTLREARHNLIEIQTQIINYLNQIRQQSEFMEKLKKVKYLKDQFELRSKTNLESIISEDNSMLFQSAIRISIKLSLEQLQEDDAFTIIRKVSKRVNNSAKALRIAGAIDDEYLVATESEEVVIHSESIKNAFIAGGTHLFDFLMQYKYPMAVSYTQKVTLYCQIISQYEEDLRITDEYRVQDSLEYAVVYPK